MRRPCCWCTNTHTHIYIYIHTHTQRVYTGYPAGGESAVCGERYVRQPVFVIRGLDGASRAARRQQQVKRDSSWPRSPSAQPGCGDGGDCHLLSSPWLLQPTITVVGSTIPSAAAPGFPGKRVIGARARVATFYSSFISSLNNDDNDTNLVACVYEFNNFTVKSLLLLSSSSCARGTSPFRAHPIWAICDADRRHRRASLIKYVQYR